MIYLIAWAVIAAIILRVFHFLFGGSYRHPEE